MFNKALTIAIFGVLNFMIILKTLFITPCMVSLIVKNMLMCYLHHTCETYRKRREVVNENKYGEIQRLFLMLLSTCVGICSITRRMKVNVSGKTI